MAGLEGFGGLDHHKSVLERRYFILRRVGLDQISAVTADLLQRGAVTFERDGNGLPFDVGFIKEGEGSGYGISIHLSIESQEEFLVGFQRRPPAKALWVLREFERFRTVNSFGKSFLCRKRDRQQDADEEDCKAAIPELRVGFHDLSFCDGSPQIPRKPDKIFDKLQILIRTGLPNLSVKIVKGAF